MEVFRYAVVPLELPGYVENVILWDGDTTQWQPPAGFQALRCPDNVGPYDWIYDGENWIYIG